ncbi:MAG: porphobilinogen synthase [Bacillota bacterium]
MDIIKRPRRLRSSEQIRNLVRETLVTRDDLIYPLFVVEGKGIKNEVSSMPGVYQLSIDNLLKELEEVSRAEINGVLLFGIPDKKDEKGTGAYADDGIIQRALREAKKEFPQLLLIADVCLCEYTSHGHCGVIDKSRVLNDETLKLIAKSSLSYAQAGADIIAPSDMMDGRVRAIRKVLDENNFSDRAIMSYSVKYASSFYGPFRDAAQSKPQFGDRKTYQMDYANKSEALREVELDIEEGADIVMVKPALAYLDIINEVSKRFHVPVAAYNVSGEYSMIKAASQKGWIDERSAVLESITSIKRAGARIIITYFAKQLAGWLKDGG